MLCPSLLEQVGMGSHPLKDQLAPLDSVDQHPVRLDMTVPSADEIARQFVVAMDRIEWLAGKQGGDKDLELVHILAAANTAFGVLSELFRIDRGVHQIPSFRNMSSASSQTTRSRPASDVSNVRFVVAVGTTTSKGRPSRSSTCL